MTINNSFKLKNIFIFLFLVLFPFGQLIRIGLLQPIDLIAALGGAYAIFWKLKKPNIFKYLSNFIIIAGTSWLVGAVIFNNLQVFYGLLYLFRLIAYQYFFVYVWNFIKENNNHKLILNSLLATSVISAVFGWIQFVVFPDIKPMFIWGWDIHLYRLVGTFFDPAFIGLIIVFGLVLTMHQFIVKANWKNILMFVFLLISLAFTYSRSSYLAFFAGASLLMFSVGKIKKFLPAAIVFLLLVFLLPTSKNHSIELLRSFSAVARLENYKQTFLIFSKSPVFGVGYNNLCLAYNTYVGYQKFNSHACSGSDSGLMFLLATTGVLGLIVFVYAVIKIKEHTISSDYKILVFASFIAFLVHSMFNNSLFYPWILAWMGILLAIAI